ncbi:MAG: M23 family metallopeptidase [Pseudomonadota bacterium]
MIAWPIIAGLGVGFVGLPGCVDSEAASPDDRTQAIAAEPVLSTDDAESSAAARDVRPTLSFTGAMTQGGYVRGSVPVGAASASLGDQALELTERGDFFAAFDRDSADTLELSVTLANGETLSETLEVSPRDWQIQRINLPKRGGGSSEAWWRKRKPEWEAITAARAKKTDAAGWKQDFIWPVKGRISGLFGRQRIYRGEPGSYHSGIDIAPGGGVPFVAPADGVVVLARTGFSLEGGLIIIDHGAGLNSAFLHASKIAVEEGQRVTQGEHIGNVGATGRATGPHLHWSLKWNKARLDPLLFTGPMN